jgi:hypothetical protein
MAGPLQWQNVQGPRFSDDNSYVDFSKVLTGALDRLGGSIKEFDGVKTTAVNREIMQRLMATQDADALKAQIADGSIYGGANRDRVSAETLNFMNSRPTQLISQDAAFRNNAQSILDQQRSNEAFAADEAMKPFIERRLAAQSSNDMGVALAALDADPAYRAARSRLSGAKQLALEGNFLDNQGDRLGLDSKRISLDAQRFANMTNQRDDAESREVARIGADMLKIGDENTAIAYLNDPANKIPGHLVGKILQYRRGMGALESAAVGSTGGGFGGGAPGSYDNFVVALESGGRADARAGTSSATGLHQFTDKTWLGTVAQARPAWAQGMSPSQILAQRTNPERSAEMEGVLRAGNASALSSAGIPVDNVNLYAMHHFGSAGGLKFAQAGGDTPVSAILSADQIAANPYLRGMTKAQAVANWNQRAGQYRPNGAQTGAAAVTTALQNAVSGDQSVAMLQDFGKDWANTATGVEIASTLTGKGGVYEGMDKGRVLTKVRSIAKEFGVSEAIAGSILKRSGSQEGWGDAIKDVFNPFSSNKSGLSFDDDQIKVFGNLFKNGGIARVAAQADVQGQNLAAVQATRQQAQSLQNRITSLESRGQNASRERSQLQMIQGQVGSSQEFGANVVASGRRAPAAQPQAQRAQAAPRSELQQRADASAQRAREAAERARAAAQRAREATARLEQLRNPKPTVAQQVAAARARDQRDVGGLISSAAAAVRSPNAQSNQTRQQQIQAIQQELWNPNTSRGRRAQLNIHLANLRRN